MKIIKIKDYLDWKDFFKGEIDFFDIYYDYNSYGYGYRVKDDDKYNLFLEDCLIKWMDGHSFLKVRNLPNLLEDMCFRIKLPEKMLEEYSKYLNWQVVAAHQNLSEKFIDKYKDKWKKEDIWYTICCHQTLSEKFIREHMDCFDETCWAEISGNKDNNLSEEFIREFQDYLHMDFIGECQIISKDFVREFAKFISYPNFIRNIYKTMKQEETLEFMPYLTDTLPEHIRITIKDIISRKYIK